MKKYFDFYLPLLINFLTNTLCYFLLIEKYSIVLILSFVITNTFILILTVLIFRKNNCYYEVAIAIYYITFFIIAPILQLSTEHFPINFPIRENQVIFANIINSLFLVVYICSRFISLHCVSKSNNTFIIKKCTIKIVWLIVIILIILFSPRMIRMILFRDVTFLSNSSIVLIQNKFLFFIPLILLYYYTVEYKKTYSKKNLFLLILSFCIVLLFKNPFTEKRNALGPIYLSILMFWINKKIDTRKFFELFLIIFLVGFPLAAVFTHSSSGLESIINSKSSLFSLNSIINQFKEMHFDAFENLCVTIDYTERYGVMNGKNIMGACLFFVPRIIWINKPLSSGQIIGNYLIDKYGFIFNNLSCTITAEAYLGGGIIGVICIAFILSLIGKKVANNIDNDEYNSLVSWYVVIQLIFLMRGDLMNGIAYLCGTIAAVYILPSFINLFIFEKE